MYRKERMGLRDRECGSRDGCVDMMKIVLTRSQIQLFNELRYILVGVHLFFFMSSISEALGLIRAHA